MQAAFYVKQGPAREVLQVGAQPTPEPGPGEVRVHLKTSGVNPSDWDACLAELNGVLQSNRLIHTVGRRLPLRDVALGHELSERGEVLGNIVLDIG